MEVAVVFFFGIVLFRQIMRMGTRLDERRLQLLIDKDKHLLQLLKENQELREQIDLHRKKNDPATGSSLEP